MARTTGKPYREGRSPGNRIRQIRKWQSPPKDEPWVWLTLEILASPSWRAMSPNCRRLMDFLLIEHRNHAGMENGNLMATHEQLTEYGLSKNLIADSIREAIFLGLIKHDRGGRWGLVKTPSIFRLTFFTNRYGAPATNEWKGKTEEKISVWKQDRKVARARKRKQISTRKS
jgi:hypothetical protein